MLNANESVCSELLCHSCAHLKVCAKSNTYREKFCGMTSLLTGEEGFTVDLKCEDFMKKQALLRRAAPSAGSSFDSYISGTLNEGATER